jgi:hypothetical protein
MSIKANVFGVMGALVLVGAATAAEARPHSWSEEREWSEDAPRQVHRNRHSWSEERQWDEDAPRQVRRKHRSKHASANRGKRRAAGVSRSIATGPDSNDGGTRRTARAPRSIVAGPYNNVGPRPGAWCGWWMRTQRGGGPEYNLAWNWSRRGQATEPKVGAVVVWRHHVGEITGRAKNGQWIVRSGNDGGRVRERARSVSGAVFRML